MRKKYSLITLLLISFSASGQVPQGYYNLAEGTSKAELKSALHNIIKDAQVLRYGSGEGYTWQGFASTDALGDGSVLDRYSTTVRYFDGFQAVDDMNIEHCLANSWWGGIKNNAYKDLHHLYPSDGYANQRKGAHPLGVVDDANIFANEMIKVGTSLSRPDCSISAWEPAEMYKGDFARTYMYMVTCYEDFSEIWQGEGLDMLDNNTYPVFEAWASELLLKWSESDPVDQTERERNEKVYAIQGNRNPFIDYPELASYIWGKDSVNVFYTDTESLSAQLFTPGNGETVNLGFIPLQSPTTYSFVVRGRNLNEPLTLSCSTDDIMRLSTESISEETVQKGIEVVLTLTPTIAGELLQTITVGSSECSAQMTFKAVIVDGIPAYEAQNITCTPYNKQFTAAWMPGFEPVTLDVYTKSEGQNISLKGYPLEITQAQTHLVENLSAQTTYYYNVKNSQYTSNEIRVDMPAVDPVFSVKSTELNISAAPGFCSSAKEIALTMMEITDPDVSFSVEYPFELSTDKISWSEKLQTSTLSPTVYIRLRAIDNEVEFDQELVISNSQVSEDLIITLHADVDINKALFEDFEDVYKSGYALGTVNGLDMQWTLSNAVVQTDSKDKKEGNRCARLNYTTTNGIGYMEMTANKANGIDTLRFLAGSYNVDGAALLSVDYTCDNGSSWKNIVNNLSVNELKEYKYKIGAEGNIRIRFRKSDNSKNKRICLDNISASNFVKTVGIGQPDKKAIQISCTNKTVKITLDEPQTLQIFSIKGVKLLQKELKAGTHIITRQPDYNIIKAGNSTQIIGL